MRKFGVHYSCVTGTVYTQFTNMAADRWLEDRALYGRYNCTSYQLMIGKKKQLQETVHSSLLLGCIYLLYMLYSNLSRMYCR